MRYFAPRCNAGYRHCSCKTLFKIVLAIFFSAPTFSYSQSNCDQPRQNPQYKLCESDPRFTYNRINLDFCGYSPPIAELDNVASQSSSDAQWALLDALLDRCLNSEFWIGKNGALWQMAYPKVRPVGAIKAGEDAGPMAGTDYYDDFALFTYINTGDRDIRDLLLAQYYVQRQVVDGKTSYITREDLPLQFVDKERRAGMITTQFYLLRYIMAALPRAAAAQLYRAYLGMDIAKGQGLNAILDEPKDYDQKGVNAPVCAVCHSTLDPLTYPFTRYTEGCQTCGPMYPPFQYVPERLFLEPYPGLPASVLETPENGYLFGEPVTDLTAVAEMAANSDEFLIAITRDYWSLLINDENPQGDAEFDNLWRSLKTENNYQIEKMLHSLIRTEAYSVP